MSFANRLFATMAAHGERTALCSNREDVSHEQAVVQANNIAANLKALGVEPGDRIGLAMQDPLEGLLCVFACWKLATTAAVIDFRAPRSQRASLVRDFDLAVVIESRSPPGSDSYPSILFNREWRFSSKAETANDQPVVCSNPAFLLFSSGTTGDPKAYIQTHDMLLDRLAGRVKTKGDGALPRYLCATTLTYTATRHHVLATLLAGGVIRLFPLLFTPSELIEGLLSFRASATGQPPPVIARMVQEAGARNEVLFPDMAVLDSMGGPARPGDKVAAWRYLTHGYRMRYASSLTGAISELVGADVLARPETTGRLMPNVRVDILDAQGNALPAGQPGVIKAWTNNTAASVLLPGGKPFVDSNVMGPGWAIPGDIGFMDGDGYLTIVDRSEDMIVRGGVNVAPQELEKLILSHPKVVEVAVAGFPDKIMGQEIAAFVVGQTDLTVSELRAFLNSIVPPDKRPREIRLVTSLPYSDKGKLLRRTLVERLVSEQKLQPS